MKRTRDPEERRDGVRYAAKIMRRLKSSGVRKGTVIPFRPPAPSFGPPSAHADLYTRYAAMFSLGAVAGFITFKPK